MPSGTPISRQWVCMLNDGTPVIDWGDGRAQDIYSGDFMEFNEKDYSHPITDPELDMLVRAGRVEHYDSQNVYIYSLPEPPRKTID